MIKFCTLYSGSSGNSIFISAGGTKVLIDAGLSGRMINCALGMIDEDLADIDAILITHEHSDHINGIGILSRRYDIPIYANTATWNRMPGYAQGIRDANIRTFRTGEAFELGSLAVLPFSVPHDAAEPVSYSLHAEGRKITVATDIGHMNESLFDNLRNSDLLLLESNHDVNMLKAGKYPYFLKRRILGEKGHLSNDTSAETICRLANEGMRRFILGHLSRENNFPGLAYETVNAALIDTGLIAGKDVFLNVAERDRTGGIVYI